MEVSANVRRAEPTPQREQDGETYSAATRSRSTSTQPIAASSTATHTSCSRIARAIRSGAARAAHRSACSLDIAGTASERMARRRIVASASSSAASARRICIELPSRAAFLVDALGAAGPVGLAELELLDLAGGGALEGRADLHRGGALEVGEAAAAEVDEGALVRRLAGAEHHQGLDRFAPLLVGHADDGGLGHGGVLE